ncbi:hypothetical protein V1358_13185 [Pseudoalteromonas sp. YIC-656]|uniref:hypothetical protein n=1 Tax=Pseudoalteromonas pernae TaxID=3118054 RepID=UPI0032424161
MARREKLVFRMMLAQALSDANNQVSLEHIKLNCGMSDTELSPIIDELELNNIIERRDNGSIAINPEISFQSSE